MAKAAWFTHPTVSIALDTVGLRDVASETRASETSTDLRHTKSFSNVSVPFQKRFSRGPAPVGDPLARSKKPSVSDS